MADYDLTVEPRTVVGKKVRQLRASGFVPAILYGRDAEPVILQCEEKDLTHVLRSAGTTGLITLHIADTDERRTALVRDIQRDVIRHEVQHVDFYQVIMTDTISTEVGIAFFGEETIDGVIVQDMNSVQIECLPGDLISTIEFDASVLTQAGDTVTISDLNVPDTVTILAAGDDLVAHVEALRVVEVEALEVEELEIGEVEIVTEESSEDDTD